MILLRNNPSFKSSVMLLLAFTLGGCASHSDIVGQNETVSLELIAPRFTHIKYVDSPINLSVVDGRSYSRIGEISDLIFERIDVISANSSISDLLQKKLYESFTSQGHKVSLGEGSGDANVRVVLQELYAKGLEDSSVNAVSKIEVTITSSDEKHIFRKTFHSSVSYPNKRDLLNKTDIKVAVEKALDLSLNKIVTDSDIHIFSQLYLENSKPIGIL